MKQFHACINSAKVIKLPSHCSNVIWTPKNKNLETGAPVSGDWRRLQRWCGCVDSAVSPSFPGMLAVWFLSSWDERLLFLLNCVLSFPGEDKWRIAILFVDLLWFGGVFLFYRDEDNDRVDLWLSLYLFFSVYFFCIVILLFCFSRLCFLVLLYFSRSYFLLLYFSL